MDDDIGLLGELEGDGDEASQVRIPCAGDPRWFGLTRPLHSFLSGHEDGCGWPALMGWGAHNGVRLEQLRQLLAALECMGDAYTVGDDVRLRWRAVGYPVRPRRSRRRRR